MTSPSIAALLRFAAVLAGGWYMSRGVQRRLRASAESRGKLDATLTRVLRYLFVSFILFGAFFFLWIVSSVKKWPAWIVRSNGIVMWIAFAAWIALALVAGWRLHAEEERLSS